MSILKFQQCFGTYHDIRKTSLIQTVVVNKVKEKVKQNFFISIIEDGVMDVSGESQLLSFHHHDP
jgi:hypothetical protein